MLKLLGFRFYCEFSKKANFEAQNFEASWIANLKRSVFWCYLPDKRTPTDDVEEEKRKLFAIGKSLRFIMSKTNAKYFCFYNFNPNSRGGGKSRSSNPKAPL